MTTLPTLTPLEMTVQAGDGHILKGMLRYPTDTAHAPFPLAVLVHQYPGTRESYGPLVVDLLARGVATLAFDLRGHGQSVWSPGGYRIISTPADFTFASVVMAFSASASAVGFGKIADDTCRVANWGVLQNFIDDTRLALVGSSVGGSGVLLAAPQVPPLKALAALGPAGAPAYGNDGARRIRRTIEKVDCPCYLASSKDDVFDAASNVRSWSKSLGHVRSRIVAGDGHGMAIYFDIRDELLEFLTSALEVS